MQDGDRERFRRESRSPRGRALPSAVAAWRPHDLSAVRGPQAL